MHLFSTYLKPVYGYLLCLFVLGIIPATAQPITITPGDYQVDQGMKLIVCNKIPTLPSSPGNVTLVFDRNYTFAGTGAAFQVGKEYTLSGSAGSYKLFFTTLPIINFNTNGQSISEDENRTKGTVSIATGTGPSFNSSMGIRVRGNASRNFPKKSYNMELWKDADGNEEFETSLFGMREDSKWFFMAMYNEPLRVNNAASWAIWLKIHQLYYLNQEPDALPGIRTRYCDVFINNSYNGVYIITEDLDRKQLKLKKTKDNGDRRGELYKSSVKTDATGFETVFNKNELLPFDNNSGTWFGYEMDYPKEPFWNSLFDLTSFVSKASDSDFKNEIEKKFRLDNLIDYFLFLNAIGATQDNFHNNQFVARYKENEPYLFLPWDFDRTLGNASGMSNTETVVENIGSNGFFYRLMTVNPNGFKSKMRKRWFALRQGEFATATFKKNLTDNVTILNNEGAYKREALKWTTALKLDQQNPIMNWIDNRMAFLDQYFAELQEEDASAVEISLLNFTGQAAGNDKQLQWTTSSEKDAIRFEVEWSTDGLSFAKVGQVAATGTSSSEKSYAFTHSNSSAVAYYRLKIINKYELFKYSNVVLIGACPAPPAVPTVSASLTSINAGQSTVLKATGCANTVLWNTGQSGNQLTVSPATTTTYQARCRQAVGCESAFSSPISITVNPRTDVDGYLNTANCSVISGWAWDSKKPNTPVIVEILEGQNVVAFLPANIYRPDLKTAGKGNGLHGYALEPNNILKDNKPHTLSARVQGSTIILKSAPKTITCPPVNNGFEAPLIAQLSANINVAYSWTLPVMGKADYGSLVYTLRGLPSGLTFTSYSREITGTPLVAGTFSLTYTANNGQNMVPTNVVLVVSDVSNNQPPQAPAVSPLSATVNAVFTTVLPQFTDSDPLTYKLEGLPNGLNFTAGTRTITGTPTVSESVSLTYTATDNKSASDFVIVLLTVDPATSVPPVTVTGNFEGYLDKVECTSFRGWVWDRNKPNTALVVEFFADNSSIGKANADVFRQDLKDAGKGNGAHVYSFTTPDFLKDGKPHTISARVKDSDYSLKDSPKTLNCAGNGTGVPPVGNNQAPQAPAVSPLSATVNTAFTTTLPPFTDTDPLSYTLTGLPSGLTFTSASRLIAGTTQVSGTYSLTYIASDSQLSTPAFISLVVSNSTTVSPPATVTGNFEGYLDKVECGSIRGWVWDRNKPNTALVVEFFANGVSIGTANADIFRQDLQTAGKGNGAHVYNFPTPSSVKTGASFQISAKVQNSTYVLNWSPKALICPVGSRLSGEEESEPGNSLTVWPNPSDGNFEIGYRLDGGKPGELSIVDAAGRGWYHQSVEGEGVQRQRVSLTGANGIFLIQLRQGNKIQSRKISIGK